MPEPDNDKLPVGKIFASMTALGLASVIGAWALDGPGASATISATDMSSATLVEIRTLEGQVVMGGELRDRVDGLGNVEKDAALLGPDQKRVVGEIEIEIPRRDAANRPQELEIDVIALEPRTSYQVVLDDRPAATFTTDDRGSVDVELDLR